MTDPNPTGASWRLTTLNERQRRENEEAMGQLVAEWSRRLRRSATAWRALRRRLTPGGPVAPP